VVGQKTMLHFNSLLVKIESILWSALLVA
jgi:hypothetical protein